MQDAEITNGNTLADEVEVNLNMLRALMLNRVGGHIDGAAVITIYQSGTVKRSMKLLEELVQPCRFGDPVSHCAILCFSTGSSYSSLTLGGPGDEIVTKKYRIARGGLACIRTACPVGISIYHKVGARGGSQQETELKSPTDIAKNALESRKVGLPWIMHVKANLLDSICNIWPGEGEVL
jgi:hypothetical protein